MIKNKGLETLHIVAFTHRNLPVSEIGKLHIEEDNQQERLSAFKATMVLDELMFLSTCNRVEFAFVTTENVDIPFLDRFFHELYPEFDDEHRVLFSSNGDVYRGLDAVEHKLSHKYVEHLKDLEKWDLLVI